MNKKKLIGMLVALVLVAALGIGATLAYFTDTTETLTNVVTMGNVDGAIVENDIKDDKVTDETTGTTKFEFDTTKDIVTDGGVAYDNVMPGDYIDKNPSVILNADSQDAWVRVSLDFDWGKLAPADQKTIKDAVIAAISTDDWKVGADGLYYYQTRMTAPDAADLTGDYIGKLTAKDDKALIATLFTGFKIDDNLMNVAINKEFKIIVNADLIQADNVKLDDTTKAAWVAANGSAITWTADGATK